MTFGATYGVLRPYLLHAAGRIASVNDVPMAVLATLTMRLIRDTQAGAEHKSDGHTGTAGLAFGMSACTVSWGSSWRSSTLLEYLCWAIISMWRLTNFATPVINGFLVTTFHQKAFIKRSDEVNILIFRTRSVSVWSCWIMLIDTSSTRIIIAALCFSLPCRSWL